MTRLLIIYNRVIDLLVALTSLTNPDFPEFNGAFFLHELSVFIDWYLPYKGILPDKNVLLDFNSSWDKVLTYLLHHDSNHVFVHKDLHCGNIFWLPQRSGLKSIGIIDFQGAKSGSYVYITSLLYDCRFMLPQNVRQNLLNIFLSTRGSDPYTFKNLCDIYIAQRNIKILGNFTHIYQLKNDSAYLKYLSNAWTFIYQALENPILIDVKKWMVQNKLYWQNMPIDKIDIK